MSRIVLIVAAFAFVMTLGAVQASADTNGRGHCFNWFRDADGDGIPNGLDEDWVRPKDGTGYRLGHEFGQFFILPMMTAGGDKVRHQYHQRNNKPETPGDHLQARLRKQDQTCK